MFLESINVKLSVYPGLYLDIRAKEMKKTLNNFTFYQQ